MKEITARAESFIGKLAALQRSLGDGRATIDWEKLRALVQADPEAVACAFPALMKLADYQKGFGHIAYLVGACYWEVCQDDSLYQIAQRKLKELGLSEPSVEDATEQEAERPQLYSLTVEKAQLKDCDIYPITRLFSLDAVNSASAKRKAEIRHMRGKVQLTFALDEDPRAVWEIQESRSYVQALFEAMPYFPYFLHPHPAFGHFMLFFSCLADLDALWKAPPIRPESALMKRIREAGDKLIAKLRGQGKDIAEECVNWQFNALHPSVVSAMIRTSASLPGYCQALGDSNPESILKELISPEDANQFESLLRNE